MNCSVLRSSLLACRSHADSLDFVAIRIAHKTRVILWAILGPQTRRAFIRRTGSQGRMVKRIDLGVTMRRKSHVYAIANGGRRFIQWQMDPEFRSASTIGRADALHQYLLREPDGGQHTIVKCQRCVDVIGAYRYMHD